MTEQPIRQQNAGAILPSGATERKDVLIQNGRIAKSRTAAALLLVQYHIFETSRTIFALQIIVFEL